MHSFVAPPAAGHPCLISGMYVAGQLYSALECYPFSGLEGSAENFIFGRSDMLLKTTIGTTVLCKDFCFPGQPLRSHARLQT